MEILINAFVAFAHMLAALDALMAASVGTVFGAALALAIVAFPVALAAHIVARISAETLHRSHGHKLPHY